MTPRLAPSTLVIFRDIMELIEKIIGMIRVGCRHRQSQGNVIPPLFPWREKTRGFAGHRRASLATSHTARPQRHTNPSSLSRLLVAVVVVTITVVFSTLSTFSTFSTFSTMSTLEDRKTDKDSEPRATLERLTPELRAVMESLTEELASTDMIKADLKDMTEKYHAEKKELETTKADLKRMTERASASRAALKDMTDKREGLIKCLEENIQKHKRDLKALIAEVKALSKTETIDISDDE